MDLPTEGKIIIPEGKFLTHFNGKKRQYVDSLVLTNFIRTDKHMTSTITLSVDARITQ